MTVLTEEYLCGLVGGEDAFRNTHLGEMFENMIPIINGMLIDPNRAVITHYDIWERLAKKYPDIA
jgi:hypothetical protein